MTAAPHTPLAERLRPRTLAEVIGQQYLLGVGKTTIARLMAQAFDAQFIAISAVLGGVKDIREAVERAELARNGQHPQSTIVFVDEVHRFKKAVKHYIKQQVRRLVVQIIVFPHCSVGVKHG